MTASTAVKIAVYAFAGLLPLTCGSGIYCLWAHYRLSKERTLDDLAFRLPDNPQVSLEKQEYVPVKGETTANAVERAAPPFEPEKNWSHFRGENFDAISKEKVPLTRDASQIKTLWELQLGEGFAGAVVRNGKSYILDYDEQNKRDALRCVSLDNGQEIWRYSYSEKIKKNHGMSRTIPVVSDQYCVALSPKCKVMCVDANTGQEKWLIDLKHTYGTTEPEWYAGQCPFIANNAAIIAPSGSDALIVALDCETGKEIWRTPNPFGWTMTHSSVMPMGSTYVYCGKGGVVGADANDGHILWSTTDWQIEIATCPSPLILPDKRIFCCGGYLSGSCMLQVENNVCKTLFRLKDAVFGSEQQTPIFYDGHIFGIRQRDKQFVCLDINGKVVWTSGAKARFGSGPYIIADGLFWILDDDGKLTSCEATAKEYKPIFETQVLDGSACWAPMTITNGRLLLRDMTVMKCLDVKMK